MIHREILFSHKKGNPAICDKEGIIQSKMIQRKTNSVWYHFYVESKIRTHLDLIETEQDGWLPEMGKEGKGTDFHF